MTVETRKSIEKSIVEKTVTLLGEAGWLPIAVHDGEELVKADNMSAVLESVFSVDESRVVFRKGIQKCMVLIVLGNDGWDVVSDHSYPSDTHEFVEIMNEVQTFAESFLDAPESVL